MPQPEKKRGRKFIVATGSSSRNMFTLSLLLQRFNYEVFIANTAAQALERISADRPALVITDLALPDMGGMDFFLKLRESQRGKAIPVIFMVPPGDAAAEHRCMAYGAAGCITKPVQAEELYWAVQHSTEQRPRSSMRIDARMPVSVDNLSLGFGAGACSIDLSEQGVRLPIDKPYPTNKRVIVQLHMRDRTISAEGKVVYYNSGNPGNKYAPGMGLMFTTIAPQDKEFIRTFVRDEIVRDVNEALTSQYPS
jgi:two-component system, chemotaxis family, chemotaxis protein CheY